MLLQLCHQRRSDGQHIALDIFRELEAMHAQRRRDLDRSFQNLAAPAFNLYQCLPALDVEQLEQIRAERAEQEQAAMAVQAAQPIAGAMKDVAQANALLTGQ